MATTRLRVTLPRPHEKQQEIEASRAKRKVIVAGRRAGKTTLAAMTACEKAREGRRVLLASPTQDQADQFWEKCRSWLAPLIDAGIVQKNETRRTLIFPNGGRIRAKTAHDADTLRGDYADFLVLDEFAIMDPSAWDLVGAPMLLDNDGDAWFISTPKRKNHFHAMYARALGDDTGRWRAWHFTSHDNPHLSRAALDEITADLTEDSYKQEIMAEFLDNEGAVFRNIAACMHAPKYATPAEHKGHRLVMGADWGKQQDYTALSVVCAECRREVAHDRFNKIDYEYQRGRLVNLAETWGVTVIVPEANSIGAPIIEQLQREPRLSRVRIAPFETTASSKPPMIESLALAMERVECQWIDDPIWTAELEAYEMKVSPTTNRPTYSAPEGVHDDTVIARGLAWSGIARARRPAFGAV